MPPQRITGKREARPRRSGLGFDPAQQRNEAWILAQRVEISVVPQPRLGILQPTGQGALQQLDGAVEVADQGRTACPPAPEQPVPSLEGNPWGLLTKSSWRPTPRGRARLRSTPHAVAGRIS